MKIPARFALALLPLTAAATRMRGHFSMKTPSAPRRSRTPRRTVTLSRCGRIHSALVVCSSIAAAFSCLPSAVHAASTWKTGANFNDKWSDDGNWEGGNGPENGSDLVFPSIGLIFNGDLHSRNDLPAGRWYKTIFVLNDLGDLSPEGYKIYGNLIELRTPANVTQPSLWVQGGSNNLGLGPNSYIDLPIRLGAPAHFRLGMAKDLPMESQVNLQAHPLMVDTDGNGFWDFSGTLTGSGELSLRGNTKLYNNAGLTGKIIVKGGTVIATHANSLGTTAQPTELEFGGDDLFAMNEELLETDDDGLYLRLASIVEPLSSRGGRIVADAGVEQTISSDFQTTRQIVSLTVGPGEFVPKSAYTIIEARENAVNLTGSLHGDGHWLFSGPHVVRISGPAVNDVSAPAAVGGTGILELDKSSGPALHGPITLKPGAILRPLRDGQLGNPRFISVGSGADLQMGGHTQAGENLGLYGGKVTGGGTLELEDYIHGGIDFEVSTLVPSMAADVRITAAASKFFVSVGEGRLDMTGNFTLDPASAATQITISRASTTTDGDFRWTGTTSLPLVEIDSATLDYTGVMAGTDVRLNGGAFIARNGTVRDVTATALGGSLRALDSSLSVRNLSLNPATVFTRRAEEGAINQSVVASGTVSLGGAVLKLDGFLSEAFPFGTRLIVVQKNSAGPVSGTFNFPPEINGGAAITEGSIYERDGFRWRISYVDVSGNDVTMTMAGVVPTGANRAWSGASATGSSWSFAQNWSANLTPEPGDSVQFPAVADRVATHNFPAGSVYNALTITATNYRLAGNRMALIGGINANYASGNADVEHGVVLAGPQTFFARQAARLRLGMSSGGEIDLNGFALALNTVNSGSVIDVGAATAGSDPPAVLSGSGSVTKSGPGTVNFNGPSDFSGPLTVSFGTARLGRSNAALGAFDNASGTTVSGASSRLELALSGGISEPLTLNGGTLQVDPDSGTLGTLGSFTSNGGTLEVASGQFNLAAAVQGSSLHKTGLGTLQFNTASTPALTGSLTTDDGLILMGSSASPNMPGSVILTNSGTVLRLTAAHQLGGAVTLNPGTTFDLNGQSDTVAALHLTQATVQSGAGSVTSPLITTGGDSCILSGTLSVPTAGTLLEAADGPDAVDVFLQAAVTGGAGAKLTKSGAGRVVLSGNNTVPTVEIADGIAEFTGVNTSAISLNGGTLRGMGTVGAVTSAAAGGAIAPGASTGILNSGSVSLNAASAFVAELNGGNPGTNYDQLKVTGTVNLGGAALQVVPGPGATGVAVIVDNDGAEAVTGTFAGLPENTIVTAGGKSFRVSYLGGTGNDVTLTVIVTGTGVTRVWDGGDAVNTNWSDPDNWVDLTPGVSSPPANGDDLVFPAGASDLANVNNLAGRTWNSIRIERSGYSITGNALTLNAGLVFDFPSGTSTVALDVTLANAQSITVLQGAQAVVSPPTALTTAGFTLTAGVTDAAGGLTMGGLAGAGSLVKTGAGRLTLGANTYTGATVLDAGLTSTDSVSCFGSATSAVVVNAAATLEFHAATGTFTRPLTLAGKLAFVNTSVIISGGIALIGAERQIEVTGGSPSLSGVISGSGGLRKTGVSPLTLSGGAPNTFTGGCTVASSTLLLGKSSGIVALPGPVTIGDAIAADNLRYVSADQIGNAATVNLVGSGAQMQCGTFSDTIGALRFTGGSVTGSGTLTVLERLQSFAAATTGSVAVNLNFPAVTEWSVADGSAEPDLRIDGEVNGPAGFAVDRSNPGTLTLSSGSAGIFKLNGGHTIVTKPWPDTEFALNGGSIGGAGPVLAITENGSGGGVLPGTSPGIFECADLILGPGIIVTMDIGGLTPGAQHDRIVAGNVADPREAVLTLVPLAGFTPQPGQSFTLVQNDGPDRMASEFFKLAEGTTFDFAGTTSSISYNGGDGNDVTLTILSISDTGTVRVWDGGGADANWMTPENWQDDTAPVAGDSLLFTAGAAQLTNSNNFPAGTNFHRLTFATNCTLNGNSILLNAGLHRIPGTVGNVSFNVPIVLTGPQTFSNLDDLGMNFGAAVSVNNNGFALTTDTVFGSDILFGPLLGSGALTVGGAGTTHLTVVPAMTGPVVVTGSADLRLQAASLGSVSSLSISGTNAELLLPGATAKTVTQPIILRGRIQSSIGEHVLTGIITVPTGATGILFPITGTLAVNNRIQGAGSVMSAGNGTLKLQGTTANTFTGGFQLSQGTVQLGKPSGVTALPGPVTNHTGFPNTIAGTLLWAAPHQVADTASIGRVANLNLAGFDETIASLTMRGGSVSTGAGTLTLTGGLTCEEGPFGAAPFPLNITGQLAFSGAGLHLLEIADSAAAIDLQCQAVVTAPAGVVVRKTGEGTATFTGACAMSDFQIAAGRVNWNGTAPGTFLTLDGGTLAGTGTFNQLTSAAAGGLLTPGTSPGSLHAGNIFLNADTTLRMEINGTAPGTGYDQITIEDESALGEAVLDIQLGYSPAVGDSFTLIASGGTGVLDIFAGLPEGAVFNVQGFTFQISYAGGSGQDVVVTCIEPADPVITDSSITPGTGPNAGQQVINISGTGIAGAPYALELSTDLLAWATLQTTTASAAGAWTFNDASQPLNAGRIFVRVRQN